MLGFLFEFSVTAVQVTLHLFCCYQNCVPKVCCSAFQKKVCFALHTSSVAGSEYVFSFYPLIDNHD